MKRHHLASAIAALAAVSALSAPPVQAGVFDDDDARKAILDLRAKVDANQKDTNTRLQTVQSGQLDLSNQIDLLRQDVAKLRGEIELLENTSATQEKREKDFYTDLDGRLRKLEPQPVTVNGRSGTADPAESRTYDSAVASFKNSDFKGALNLFLGFARDYPNSVYMPSAQYYIGASYYAQRDFKSAIAAQQVVLKTWPDDPRAADAMFNIASCQSDMGDKRSARKTLENLVAAYPDSQAAGVARDRLVSMK
jgi:tol-pal system protein YbgF